MGEEKKTIFICLSYHLLNTNLLIAHYVPGYILGVLGNITVAETDPKKHHFLVKKAENKLVRYIIC